MNSKVYVAIPLHLIQSIRLLHSLMESDHTICIPAEYESKLSYLKTFFDLDYCICDSGCESEKVDIEILHEIPKTRIGSIERELIFPHGVFQYCRNLWQDKRNYKFAFAGLLTEGRKTVMKDWFQKNWPTCKCKSLTNNTDYSDKVRYLKKRLFGSLNLSQTQEESLEKCGDFFVWSSERGRHFPIKMWDASYFEFLSNSQFVVCPDGDFVWTYRFFEAIMCGAIPVIQNYSPIYQGFRFKHMDLPTENMQWDKCDAEFNFQLCKERLTISIEDINTELDRFSINAMQ